MSNNSMPAPGSWMPNKSLLSIADLWTSLISANQSISMSEFKIIIHNNNTLWIHIPNYLFNCIYRQTEWYFFW